MADGGHKKPYKGGFKKGRIKQAIVVGLISTLASWFCCYDSVPDLKGDEVELVGRDQAKS